MQSLLISDDNCRCEATFLNLIC